jgi:hypothetical protein
MTRKMHPPEYLGKGPSPLKSPGCSPRNASNINGLGKRERNSRFQAYNGLMVPILFPVKIVQDDCCHAWTQRQKPLIIAT